MSRAAALCIHSRSRTLYNDSSEHVARRQSKVEKSSQNLVWPIPPRLAVCTRLCAQACGAARGQGQVRLLQDADYRLCLNMTTLAAKTDTLSPEAPLRHHASSTGRRSRLQADHDRLFTAQQGLWCGRPTENLSPRGANLVRTSPREQSHVAPQPVPLPSWGQKHARRGLL